MGTTYLNSDKCSLPLEVVAREGEGSLWSSVFPVWILQNKKSCYLDVVKRLNPNQLNWRPAVGTLIRFL